MDGLQQDKKYIFALDIGTRSVVGTVGVMEDDFFKVIDYEQRFHAKRAMRDGQIEDIKLVAKVVKDVKETLEKRVGVTFCKVSIAAAGRSLKTIKTTYHQEVLPNEEITQILMQGVEYSALSKAMDEFSEKDDIDHSFHCVGYSVVRSSLDEYDMSNLVGHKGKKITIDLIAAFLPHNVVEGLYATMSLTGLEVENLTLEPMAAIHVIVPKDIRLLNIALVDIGAGTSDIAICRNGGISAYDMVTVAGDELTEKIMQRYLVEFDEAEKIKFALSGNAEIITFKDVLGFENTVEKAEIFDFVKETVQELAQIISERIIEINTNSPVAVFIVGGGSQVPGLTQLIAERLNLPPNRVTVGGKQGFKYVELCSESLNSPEFVTPIGIGAIISERVGSDFFAITVNGNKIMLLRQGEIKVMEAILLAGIRPTALIGVPPRPVNYTLNGEKRVFRQEYTSGEIKINGETASIDSTLSRGDSLVVVPAKTSSVDKITVQDLKENSTDIYVSLNEAEYILTKTVLVNGDAVADDYVICNGDAVVIKDNCLLENLCNLANITFADKIFTLNGVRLKEDDILNQYDQIEYTQVQTGESATAAKAQTNSTQSLQAEKPENAAKEEQSAKKLVVPVKILLRNQKTDTETQQAADIISTDAVQAQKTAGGQKTDTETQQAADIISTDAVQAQKTAGGQKTDTETQQAADIISTDAVQAQKTGDGQKTDKEENQNVNSAFDNKTENVPDDAKVKPITAQENGYVPYEQRKEKGYIFVTINKNPTKVKAENDNKAMFVNMLNYVKIENEAPGESLVLEINGNPASYTDEVCDGDEVTIKWE